MSGASIVRGDALHLPLGDGTVDLIITSPPYFALRSYQDGGEHYDGQIGSEPTPTAFLEALWAVTAECWRVLKPSGSLFVNLGDKYAGTGGGNGQSGIGGPKVAGVVDNRTMPKDNTKQTSGLVRAKSLMGLPWRYAIGCTDGMADPEGKGWILRSEIVWSKPNALPESVRDRVRRSHEQWFHLTKNGTYYADMDRVREPHATVDGLRGDAGKRAGMIAVNGHRADHVTHHPLGKLPDSVWAIPTQPLIVPEWLGVDHFAAFPTEWPRRIIEAWCPKDVCTACGQGRRSTTTKRVGNPAYHIDQRDRTSVGGGPPSGGDVTYTITGEDCACPDTSAPSTPGVVLDPFGGTGTTAMVARALGRYGVSMDLSADYLRLARWRIFESGQAARVRDRSDAEAQGVLL